MGISGGIAAYKVCELISRLFQLGAEVRVILTDAAEQFITPLTVTTLARHPAYGDRDFWQPDRDRPLHIELGEWAELIVLAPLTANTLGKLAWGLADNLLTNTILASRCSILVAPAMNTEMWEQAAVRRNWQQVMEDPRYRAIAPSSGLLACDRIGTGRMAEPAQLLTAIESLLWTGGKRDLVGKEILVSAGGTREHLDPVRFIGNPSTGKMGVAIALAARYRGAAVTLVHAPLADSLQEGLEEIRCIPTTDALAMERALRKNFGRSHWTVMAAAVADVMPANYTPHKLAKAELPEALPLKPVPDIVAALGRLKTPEQVVVGFAAQTGDIVPPALDKLKRKHLDLIVANPVDRAGAGFGADTNQATIVDRDGGMQSIAPCSKLALAHQLLDCIRDYELRRNSGDSAEVDRGQ